MRITNPMIMNRMSLNFNRNARQVDTLYNQLSTGKKIIFPSDDPILATRALKFRTSVTETEQYQRNVSQGLSWMEVTEGAMKNVTSLMQRIRELAVQGASDENRYDDRHKIAVEMEQLIKQLGTEMNVSYAGRYIFSGFRTDEPPVFEKNQPNLIYTVYQDFFAADIEVMKTYQRVGADVVQNDNVNIIKLAYSEGINHNATEFRDHFDVVSLATHPDAYNLADLPAGKIRYIQETGELVIPDDLAESMKSGAIKGIRVHYDKHGFKAGELNPKVYFNCVEWSSGVVGTAPSKSYDMDNQDFEYEFGVNTRIPVNTLAKDVYTAVMFADLNNFVQQLQGMRLSTEEEVRLAPFAAGWTDDQIKEHLMSEESRVREIMQDRFNNLIEIMDRHSSTVSTEHTDLGSRMSRLELIETRLEQDRINFKKLLSDNEDVDYTEAAMQMTIAETVYQAALQVGARVMQISLADYIR